MLVFVYLFISQFSQTNFSDGGMDGGWFLTEEVMLRKIESCFQYAANLGGLNNDSPLQQLCAWATTNNVSRVCYYGRDTGAAIGNTVILHMKLSGTNYSEQIKVALSGFEEFGFPLISDDIVQLIQTSFTSTAEVYTCVK